MGHLNRVLTSVFTVMAGYVGAYSAYVERSAPPWSLGYEPYDARLGRLRLSFVAALISTSARA
jgi:hypothetical protein